MTLRDLHLEQTRELIVDAVVALLAEGGAFEFSMFEIARRAGVSVRTVYRHFPERDHLFAAVSARMNTMMGQAHYGRSLDELPELAVSVFERFDAHASLVIARVRTGAGQAAQSGARATRLATWKALVVAELPALSADDQEALAAMIATLFSSQTWYQLRTEQGLDGARSGRMVAAAMRTLLSDARSRNAALEAAKEAR